MPEYVKSTPRTAKVTSVINPNLQFCIAEKGGISVYGLQRFPITLFWSQWQELFAGVDVDGTSFFAELSLFATENEGLLATKDTATTKADDKPDSYTLNSNDIKAVSDLAAVVQTTDVPRYARLMSIKTIAEMNKGKVPFDMMKDAIAARIELTERKTNPPNQAS